MEYKKEVRMCAERFCEKMCNMHKSPVNCLFHLIAAIIIIYALWEHSLGWILIGILVGIVGHIIQESGNKGKKVEKKIMKKKVKKRKKR